MNCSVQFFLPSGERNPKEHELQKRPLVQFISDCIAHDYQFFDRCWWFSGKTIEAKFWYPEGGSTGEFLLAISCDYKQVPEGVLSQSEIHLFGFSLSECDFFSDTVSGDLETRFRKEMSEYAEEVKYSMFWGRDEAACG